jgi:hypothetical protein
MIYLHFRGFLPLHLKNADFQTRVFSSRAIGLAIPLNFGVDGLACEVVGNLSLRSPCNFGRAPLNEILERRLQKQQRNACLCRRTWQPPPAPALETP